MESDRAAGHRRQLELDAARLASFMHSFHVMSNESHWARFRGLSRQIKDLAEVELSIRTDTGKVQLNNVPVDSLITSAASGHARQFLVSNDETKLGNVIKSAGRLGVIGEHFDEARSQWKQLTDRRFTFRTVEQECVGVIIGGQYITWDEPHIAPASRNTGTYDLALSDFLDVYVNEGKFHPLEPNGRKPKVYERRSVVRSIPAVWQKRFTNMSIAATIYAATILHHEIGEADDRWKCDDACNEHKIMLHMLERERARKWWNGDYWLPTTSVSFN